MQIKVDNTIDLPTELILRRAIIDPDTGWNPTQNEMDLEYAYQTLVHEIEANPDAVLVKCFIESHLVGITVIGYLDTQSNSFPFLNPYINYMAINLIYVDILNRSNGCGTDMVNHVGNLYDKLYWLIKECNYPLHMLVSKLGFDIVYSAGKYSPILYLRDLT